MATGEAVSPTKSAKTSTTQDQPSVAKYAEWAAAFQAFYNGTTPPGYFPPVMSASPQPHPYMWAGQPVIPPYGAASPYAAMYPGGHIYGHPTISQGTHPYPYGIMSPGNATEAAPAATSEADCRSLDEKKQSPFKKSKESTGSSKRATKKGEVCNKEVPTSVNGALSQSGETDSDGSSNASGEDNGKSMLKKRSFEQTSEGGSFETNSHMTGHTTAGGASQLVHSPTNPGGIPPGAVHVRTTGLNVGIDYWSGAPQGASVPLKGNHNPALAQGVVPAFPNGAYLGAVGGESGTTDRWVQDERELKRQRRKQSNRESARRSRLRKQAECEELAARVDALTVENMALRSEISRLVEERDKLSSDNCTLLERVKRLNSEDGGSAKERNEAPYAQFQLAEKVAMTNGLGGQGLGALGGSDRGEDSCNSADHVSTGLNIGGRAVDDD